MFLSSCSCNCTDFFIIQWVASILGYVMNALYEFLSLMNIANIGLCIIIFTIIVKLLMLPMTIKQQKFTKLSSVINPEIQEIQKKYRNKNDQESMIRMREETNAVYEKYGTSASGSCLQLLIQMPILFALYAVVSSIPTYVGDVSDMYMDVSKVAYESVSVYNELDDINGIIGKENKDFSALVDQYYLTSSELEDMKSEKKYADMTEEELRIKAVYNQFILVQVDSWDNYDKMYSHAETIIKDIKAVKDWDKLIKDNEDDKELIEKYSKMSDEDLDNVLKTLKSVNTNIDKASEPISDAYGFLGINLSKSPSAQMSVAWWAILIPILSAVTQWISVKISQSNTKSASNTDDNPMLQSMNTTMMFMPLMSAFFCYSFAAALGLYWVIGSVIQIVQQIFINMYFKKLDVNDIIKQNITKINKKRAAQGLPPQKITQVANSNVKNIKYDNKPVENAAPQKSAPASNTNGKKMSIAQKANMVKTYNENNKK